MATPESKVKAKIKKILDKHGAYHFSPMSYGMGTSGVPDLICCVYGYFVAIEVKAGKGKPTKLQLYNLDLIRKAGGYATVANETDYDRLDLEMKQLAKRAIKH